MGRGESTSLQNQHAFMPLIRTSVGPGALIELLLQTTQDAVDTLPCVYQEGLEALWPRAKGELDQGSGASSLATILLCDPGQALCPLWASASSLAQRRVS